MIVLKSILFNQFPELIFGFSTKVWNNEIPPYYFNLSLSVGDDEEIVKKNREQFFNFLELGLDKIVFQKQIHSDIVKYVDKPGFSGEGDSLITDKPNIGLAVSVGDCTPIFIYDKLNKVISAVHSGWRSTQKQILKKTLQKLKDDFNSQPENIYAYIGPSITQKNYEVGNEVAELFDPKYSMPVGEKFLLNVQKVNYDMLIKFGIPSTHIQVSNLCTYESKNMLHSYRRDGAKSGRSYGVLAFKSKL
ncbi:MAG: peptidoglycan editing factor PgeF [Ignavibacteriales bacterium]|nr:peptidoglycan editing factor PgeF [Ignavibacteriales bacterium]